MLPFLDRIPERGRLQRLYARAEGSLAVLFGRRRCGKSRLLVETLPRQQSVYFVADEREAPVQRAALAVEIGRLLSGFEKVHYPDWDSLLDRWWNGAPRGAVLVLDGFQALATGASELPSLLQRYQDTRRDRGCHLVLSGSSQRLMQGLLLDRTAPLFGRATELMKISPLEAGWIGAALGLDANPIECVESYATWGGVPRYWELAADFAERTEAVKALVLDPLGVLHREPEMLLLDDVRDPAQSASILVLVGAGCHRVSEIAGRLGKPASSLARPLQRLLDLELIRRDRPFGTSFRDTKKSLYRIADPFLRYWFRYVAPNRSRLEARLIRPVADSILRDESRHVAEAWEDLARASVPRLGLFGREWNPASPWWGNGRDGCPLEVDLVTDSTDGTALLVGSVKWEEETRLPRTAAALAAQVEQLPFVEGRQVHLALWVKRSHGESPAGCEVLDPGKVLKVLR
ncbi:MAG: ATP-binding protein [Armatimonadetes bacterium]|nr:ATP-binding protein [Armatimonadota bacterium]